MNLQVSRQTLERVTNDLENQAALQDDLGHGIFYVRGMIDYLGGTIHYFCCGK